MATTETFVPGRLYEMPLADLQPDPNQPRKYLDPAALDELTESVKQQSVVAPILFRVENGIAYFNPGENRKSSRKSRRVSLPLLVVICVQPMSDRSDGPPQPRCSD